MLKRWSMNLAAVLAWLGVIALALVDIAVGANLYEMFALVTLHVTRYTSTITVQIYYVAVGLLWLVFFVWMEHYLIGSGVREGLLWTRVTLILGCELAGIALIGIGSMIYRKIEVWQVMTTLVEVLLAAGLIYLSRRLKKSTPQSRPV
jgi:hypothetical protein